MKMRAVIISVVLCLWGLAEAGPSRVVRAPHDDVDFEDVAFLTNPSDTSEFGLLFDDISRLEAPNLDDSTHRDALRVSSIRADPLLEISNREDASDGFSKLEDISTVDLTDRNIPSMPSCWADLSCDFMEIESMSLEMRIAYIRYMEDLYVQLNSGNQFRAIEGTIQFFINEGLGGRGTWISYVDAGIVEGIERGGAIALGIGTDDGGNPGSRKWASFLTAMKNGELMDRNVRSFESPIHRSLLPMIDDAHIYLFPRLMIAHGQKPNKPQQNMAKQSPNRPAL